MPLRGDRSEAAGKGACDTCVNGADGVNAVEKFVVGDVKVDGTETASVGFEKSNLPNDV